jgi:hypothetical protein
MEKGMSDKSVVRVNMNQMKDDGMSKQMEKDHIKVIAHCRNMIQANPHSELWGIEMSSTIQQKQFFRIVDATVPRKEKPLDMREEEFHAHMLQTLVESLKMEEMLTEGDILVPLLIEPAQKIAAMMPQDLHRLYMARINGISSAMTGKDKAN